MSKRTIGIVIAIIIAIAGFWFLTTPPEQTEGTPSNHTFGQGSTGVVLMEYADFQCPACRAYYPILQQVKEKYEAYITFQVRHFPLESIHKNARAAARAAEAAGNQGKFWEMHDMLFERQDFWKDSSDPLGIFEGYASEIGVEDIAKFGEDSRSSAVNAVINADLAEGRDVGVSSTPTFVLDGKKLEDSPGASLEAFSVLIDDAIRAKGGTPPESTSDALPQEAPVIEPSTEPEETTPEDPNQ